MLKPFIVILLLPFSTICYAQSIYTALHLNDDHEYKFGKPKQITEDITFYLSNGTQVDKNVKLFDKAGMLLTEERYDDEAKLRARLSYLNDTTKHIKLSRMFERWSKYGSGKQIATYTYDNQNFLISSIDSNTYGKVIDIVQIKNNSKGDPIELILFDGNNNPFGKETAEYDYDNNIVIISVFQNDGTRLSSTTSKIRFGLISKQNKSDYNQYNDVINYTTTNLNGSTNLFECEYKYDIKGNWTEERTYKVELKSNGKKKRTIDKIFKKEIIY